MENQPKLTSSKEIIALLAETFPNCFCVEGEARPLKIGIFQDLVERVPEEINLSKTRLRSALRLYTSSWRYLHGIKSGATRIDLDGNPCGELEEQHVAHAHQQLAEAKARIQAYKQEQKQKRTMEQEQKKQAKPRVSPASNGSKSQLNAAQQQTTSGKTSPPDSLSHKVAAQKSVSVSKVKTGKRQQMTDKINNEAVTLKQCHLSAAEVAALVSGQTIQVKVGKNAMQATVQEVAKEGVRVLLASGMSMIVRAEHLMF